MDLPSNRKHHSTSVQFMHVFDYTVCTPYVCSTGCTPSLEDTTDNVQLDLEGNKIPQVQKVRKSLGGISFIAAPLDFRLR